jgi:type IV pilus assembly protein PilM
MSVLSFVRTLMPPPRFLALPSIGVDISDTTLKYVALSGALRPGAPQSVRLWGSIDIPTGVVSRGEVNDVGKLTAVLRELKAATGADFVRVSLPEERAYLFETQIKRDVPSREIRSTLEFRLEENVPIPSREVFFDYEILPHHQNERSVQVVVAAYARDTILKFHEASVAAGLTPLAFVVEAQAMARAVVKTGTPGTVMLVDFGKNHTGIGIVMNGTLVYTATIEIGGNNLSQAMRKVLGDRSEEELTHLKNTQGLIRAANDSRPYDALISTVSVIRDEVAARMEYWHSKETPHSARRINRIILGGGGANLKGLPEYFSETLGVPCERGDVWTNVAPFIDELPPIERRFSHGYAIAIGLALERAA